MNTNCWRVSKDHVTIFRRGPEKVPSETQTKFLSFSVGSRRLCEPLFALVGFRLKLSAGGKLSATR